MVCWSKKSNKKTTRKGCRLIVNILKLAQSRFNHVWPNILSLAYNVKTIIMCERPKDTCFGHSIVMKMMKIFMDHQDVGWPFTLVIQRYQLQVVEQICNSQEFAQRYVPLSTTLPASKFVAKGWFYCLMSKTYSCTFSCRTQANTRHIILGYSI
jgi:hypothetical protein